MYSFFLKFCILNGEKFKYYASADQFQPYMSAYASVMFVVYHGT
jgi:hypothetical protein